MRDLKIYIFYLKYFFQKCFLTWYSLCFSIDITVYMALLDKIWFVTSGYLETSMLMLCGKMLAIDAKGYAPACCSGLLPQIHIHQWIKCNGRLCIGMSCSAISVAGMVTLSLFNNICQNLSVKAIRIDRIWCYVESYFNYLTYVTVEILFLIACLLDMTS